MLALARENQARSGLTHVEFLKGEIEHIPLPDNSVDVIISNCVINLSADKDRVIAEAFRMLKSGGRFAVSDVVVRGDDMPAALRRSMELWVGCVSGALEESTYRSKLSGAGFEVFASISPRDCAASWTIRTHSNVNLLRVRDHFPNWLIRGRHRIESPSMDFDNEGARVSAPALSILRVH